MLDFWNNTILYFQQNPYELGGVIASLICVWLNTRENIWGWLWAIIGAVFYIRVYYDIRLYGDLLLQFFFISISIYGIYQWLYGGKYQQERQISYLPTQLWLVLLGTFLVGTWALGSLLRWLNGDLAYIDAATTSISLIAQWMLARKYLENWLLWVFVNILYVGIYFYKAVYLTSVLYAIFFILALIGYRAWRKTLHQHA